MSEFSFLADEAPGFAVKGAQVQVITDPTLFHEELCRRAKSAKTRITLAALYLGTGDKEQRLVDSVRDSLKQTDGKVRVNFLIDYCRGNRVVKGRSSCTMLLPLIRDHEDSCKVYLYHTPCLRGLLKKVAPQKFNETLGLQHCKVYLFDDSLIVSGANMSNDYFTDRQDRYMLIKDCPKLADFYELLVKHVSAFSLRLCAHEDGSEPIFKENPDFEGGHPYLGEFQKFVDSANRRITAFLKQQTEINKLHFADGQFLAADADESGEDTWIFPSVQMGQLGVVHDSTLTSKFLNNASNVQDAKLKFGTGYFNLTDDYVRSVVRSGRASFDIVMAHPKANSFYKASFPLYGVACAYTHLARQFFDLCKTAAGGVERISMYEYQRPGWTFHGKGLWYYKPDSSLPTATMVGSPNFGYRSVEM